jgi:group I intron endonuclease
LYTYFSINFLQTALEKGGSLINRALLKYGYSNFSFSILEYPSGPSRDLSESPAVKARGDCDKEMVIKREQHFIDLIKPEYNLLKIAGSSKGYKHSEEAIQKIITAAESRIYSEELREKLRASTLSRIESIRIAVVRANGHPVLFTDTETGETTEYCSMREAAREMQVSARTIINYIKENKIF